MQTSTTFRLLQQRACVAALILLAAIAACSDGGRRKAGTPTAPSAVASAGGEANGMSSTSGEAPGSDVADPSGPSGRGWTGSRNIYNAVEFPARDGTFAFRQQLETAYRDQLRRSPTSSFVDIEGTIVWTQEYLRYRVNGCGHQDAITRVQAQIQGHGIQPICVDFTGTTVAFPPRNEPFAFRQELERIYRDELRRSAVQTFVDAEGDIVWTQEYLRYRLNGCSQTEATDRVLTQVSGGPVQPTCIGSANGSMTATIDGVPWMASVSVQGTITNGLLAIAGTDNRQLFSFGVTVNRGPATYTVGVADPFNIVVANLITGGQAGWDASPLSGSGTVTIATLTSTAVSGTFSLTLTPTPGTGATGNRVLTNGIFNVPLTAPTPLPPAPGNVNGTITALVDGAAWRGAFVARATNTSGLIALLGTDADTRSISVVVVASGPGTYSLNCCGNPNNAIMIFGGQQWFSAMPGGLGSVTITSLTSTRVTGTFTITMQPSLANTPPVRVAQVTNGQFDLAF